MSPGADQTGRPPNTTKRLLSPPSKSLARRGPVKLQDVKSELAGYGGSCCQAGGTQEQWCGEGHRLWDLVQSGEEDTEPAGWVGQRER